ncbi:uncharacterized protein BKCO1_6800037 [Diplodia corticola]|uniref:Uncharacterized protein n=1 Tax=Diplodia corticola TaxID=236234 RepID=A0A1J9RC17_9PEZI|nr:uncharacterized protein BKCO1_6800037 [Diplodia corticola]OJD30011.1 hypothetical protein BKCO1_6800037 [Diplodia corticola]
MCFCTGTTEYDPHHPPPPRIPTHTAYARPASRSSYHSTYRHSSTGPVAALPPSRRSFDDRHHHAAHHSTYRSSATSVPSERHRYVESQYEQHPQPARHSVQLVERRPRGVSPGGGGGGGGRVVRERERVVYV